MSTTGCDYTVNTWTKYNKYKGWNDKSAEMVNRLTWPRDWTFRRL